jgi:TM2 domain-containing membrane protein YozV
MEYERIYFVSRGSEEKSLALLKKSYCQKKLGNYESAIVSLTRAENGKISDSLKFLISKEHALLCYLNDDCSNAELMLGQLDQLVKDTLKQYDYLYLKIIVKNELMQWDESTALLKKYVKHNHVILDEQTQEALFKHPKLLNAKTARVISYIIPGSGQIYSGHVFRGLTSIGFQGGSLLYTILAVQNKFYLTGIFTGFGLMQMFYFGGARYAAFLAEKENAKKSDAYNKKIRDFVLSVESASK